MTEISANSRRLFVNMVMWLRPRTVDEFFRVEGFRPGASPTRRVLPGRARAEQYHAAIDWDDPDQVLRVLGVYQAAIDQCGRLGSRMLPAANVLLASLHRDGHYAVDGELILLPRADPRGALRGKTGWDGIDHEIGRLRWEFEQASQPSQCNAVGLHCVRVLSLVIDAVFDPARHVAPGHDPPGSSDIKGRFDCFLTAVAPGRRFEHLRKLVNAAYGQANSTKHRPEADRTDAGVAVTSTILLAEAIRLLADAERDELASKDAAQASP